ncbi:Ribosomal RNA small subunit methyltransferase H [Candidatus Cyrtobacter comes]|uniref:Ribosomal RNA small subunit methyltransferase H n=1 Tax=Candidatus Cyrtobacter comes TaxID=675776 RepID=A0ABU5L7B8_9RICK|nr:16S rRNA (cytosine(1402)-N(4))-methyltransferase RsmH [Candidatus Cyrtobacter comes]MDZ5762031.1 Ribosomal RNA small subunit methyltransferase H [Candidatus Cyrtobacter comes]
MHVPVLIDEVISNLCIKSGGSYLDCTFGAGGYSKRILRAADCYVTAIDADHNVGPYADNLKNCYGDNFNFRTLNFSKVDVFPEGSFDGIVFDLGVSSMQLDISDRGFSFMKDGPLDMRMDQYLPLDASKVVNLYEEKELADIIFYYGDERNSRKIAKAICFARKIKQIESTLELVEIISSVLPFRGKIHQATKIFQAIRMEVNAEMSSLKIALEKSIKLLKKGAVIILVTFHSIEDKIVKDFFKTLCLPRQKKNKYGRDEELHDFKIITHKPIIPSDREVTINPRARSAKMRILKRC